MKKWQTKRLGELGEVNRGRSRHRPRYAEHLYGGTYPFIQTGDIKASNGRITSHQQTYSEAGLAQSRLWPAGTLCITIAANIAETGILSYPACFPDSVVGFVADQSKCEVLFIEYMFRHLRRYIQHEATGSVQDNINLETLSRLEIPLPPLSVQRAIASVLGALDDKIELNRRMNETLEALAQSLFKSWFVDATQSALPKGWSAGKLSDIAEIVMGLSPDGESYNADGEGTPLINGPVEFGDYYPVKAKWTTSPTRMARAGDLIFCVRGSTTGRRVISDDAYCLGRGVCGIRAKNGAPTFLYQTVNFGLENLLSKTTGSVFPSLSAPDIKGFPVVLPPLDVVAAFSEKAEPLTKRIQANVRESRTLAALRDALLPKLLSGELRVTAPATSAKAHL
jgi:type I restriction enzyme S subunit